MIRAGMGSLAPPAGVGARQEGRVEDRLDDGAKRMLGDPVAERQGGNLAPFRIEDFEASRLALAVGAAAHFVRQALQIERGKFLEFQMA